MNLVSYSIRTKGVHTFARRLGTVFTRFGFSETASRRALHTIVRSLQAYNAAPTFFIPAVVLRRHPALIALIADAGAEIGIHGYVHNDYRTLNAQQQHAQTQQAISVFEDTAIDYQGFRNPYLGWTEETLKVFTELNFAYESNEAVFHDIVELEHLPIQLKDSYQKSLALFQAIPCTAYSLRPHFEGQLLRIPTSIPDDEMLFDRLRITNAQKVGHLWCCVMQRVYNLGGLYTLNLHPERGLLCKQALDILLAYARRQPLPIWIARLRDVAQWWKERSAFRFIIIQQDSERWRVEAHCSERATVLARHLTVEDQAISSWSEEDFRVPSNHFTVRAARYPGIALSAQTPEDVLDFLLEQGYPCVRCSPEDAQSYALYLDLPTGLGPTRQQQMQQRSALVEQIEQSANPLLRFGCWPNGHKAALAISGDIDSITVQDFFMRIIEVL